MNIIWTFTLLMIPGVVSTMSVMGYSGGGVTITCRYDEGYTENEKYFCKGQWSECTDRLKTNQKDKSFNSGRFSLYDDRSSAVFTVTIRDLSEGDSGTYYCGIERSGIDFSSEVKLKVITEQNTASSSLIIGVTVILLLLIVGFVSFVVILYKKHQTRDPDSASNISDPGTENSEAVPQPLYEEIKDTRLHIDCKSAQLPTNPSDSSKTVYATPQLPTNPSDSSKMVSATPQLPTNPSDSSKMVSATPQLPTNPSDSSKNLYDTVL